MRAVLSGGGVWGRGVSGVVVGVLVVGLGFGWWWGEGSSASRVVLGSGSVWFGASGGVVALVDGGSGRRVAAVTVRGVEVDEVAQVGLGSSAVVADRGVGSLVGVDGALREVGSPAEVASGGDESLGVFGGGGSVWVVSQGATLVSEWLVGVGGGLSRVEDGGGGSLSAPVGLVSDGAGGGVREGAVVVSDEGVLWAVGSGGELRSYEGGRELTRSVPLGGRVSEARVVLAGGVPVVLDAGRQRGVVVDPSSGEGGDEVCFDVPRGDVRVASVVGEGRVVAVDGVNGTLVVSDVDAGVEKGCESVSLEATGQEGRPRFGVPVVRDGLAFVPDNVDGTVVVVDLDAGRVKRTLRLDLVASEAVGRFVLSAQGGHVWFDDPGGDEAGVITDELSVIKVDKVNGDGEPQEVLQDGPVEAPEVALSCGVSPVQAQPGQVVTVTGYTEEGVQPDSWVWSMPGGDPDEGKGQGVETRFEELGDKAVTGTAMFGDRSEEVSCGVKITDTPIVEDPGPLVPGPTVPGSATTTTTVKGAPGGGDSGEGTTTPVTAQMRITPNPATVGAQVTLQDTTQGAVASRWSIDGQQQTSTATTITWTPTRAGTVNIALTSTLADGRIGATQQTLTINPATTDTTTPTPPLEGITVVGNGQQSATGGEGEGQLARTVPLRNPRNPVFAPNGDLYFEESDTQFGIGFLVRRVDAESGLLSGTLCLRQVTRSCSAPRAFLPSGEALVVEGGRLYVVDPSSWIEQRELFDPTMANGGSLNANDLAVDDDGEIAILHGVGGFEDVTDGYISTISPDGLWLLHPSGPLATTCTRDLDLLPNRHSNLSFTPGKRLTIANTFFSVCTVSDSGASDPAVNSLSFPAISDITRYGSFVLIRHATSLTSGVEVVTRVDPATAGEVETVVSGDVDLASYGSRVYMTGNNQILPITVN